MDLGYYVSLSGHIFKRSAEELKSMAAMIPSHRLMFETDAPYLGFKHCRSFCAKKKKAIYPNVPSALPMVLEHYAAASGGMYSLEEVRLSSTQTALNFFSVPKSKVLDIINSAECSVPASLVSKTSITSLHWASVHTET